MGRKPKQKVIPQVAVQPEIDVGVTQQKMYVKMRSVSGLRG